MQRVSIAVIGLGRFGFRLAQTLHKLGAQVIAIDSRAELVDQIKDDVDKAVRLDSTSPEALKAQEIDRVDTCVIAIGEEFENSLLTTTLLLKMGIKRVICRAQTAMHAEIFKQIGAHEVVQPESNLGELLAQRLVNPQLRNVVPLADGYSIVEIAVPRDWVGKTLRSLEMRSRHDVNLVAIKRPKHDAVQSALGVISVPKPDESLLAGDLLVLVGSHEAIERLPQGETL